MYHINSLDLLYCSFLDYFRLDLVAELTNFRVFIDQFLGILYLNDNLLNRYYEDSISGVLNWLNF